MDRLPAEILQEIVGYLPEQDLDSVRLANHKLSAAANVFKYRVLRVRVSRQGLDHLLYVSQQPALARCVREIVYPWHHLLPLLEPWTNKGPVNLQKIDSSSFEEYVQLASIFLEWYNKTIYASQVEVEESGESVAALEVALPRMSNVRVLSPGICISDLRDEFYKWRGTLTDPGCYNIDMDWNNIWRRILNLFKRTSREDSNEAVEKLCEDEQLVGEHFLDLLDVSHHVGLKPDQIGSTIDHESSPWLGFAFLEENFGILQNCMSLIENLTTFRLAVSGFGDRDDEDMKALERPLKKSPRLHKFLSSASNLRSLSLDFRRLPLWARGNFSLLDIVGRTRTWKHLHTFQLQGTDVIDSGELVYFLRGHSETLEALHLDFYFIGSSRNLLDDLKEQLHLKKFGLEVCCGHKEAQGMSYIYYSRDEIDRMRDYVLHGGPAFPPKKIQSEEEEDNEEMV
ncbi:hypothetical protein RUND412_010715 [Rhizina undulata]